MSAFDIIQLAFALAELRACAEYQTCGGCGWEADMAPTCRRCAHWSQWLGSTGDCLVYADKRRAALLAADADPAAWPVVPARMTASDDTCDDWESAA
ncbi:MAG TPA: hypothetical protein VGG29_20735 [Caulobacteraceae bacterium]|jgi:hypothetical protein